MPVKQAFCLSVFIQMTIIATFKNIFEKICNNAEDCLNKKQHREC